MLTETIGTFIAILSVVYIYYKYVIFNFWRKKGVVYVEPIVPAGNLTALVTGKISIGEYTYLYMMTIKLYLSTCLKVTRVKLQNRQNYISSRVKVEFIYFAYHCCSVTM